MTVILILLATGTHVHAEESGKMPNLATLAPTTDEIVPAVQDAKRLGCHTTSCQTLVKLDQIYDAVLEGIATTMGGPVHDLSPDQHIVEERRLHRILLDHPRDYGSMCALLTSLNSRYGKPGARGDIDQEKFVGVTNIDIALRMDGNGPPDCLPKVLAAMPHTDIADAAIEDAKSLCEYRSIARNPCSRINR